MGTVILFNFMVAVLFFICYSYQFYYVLVPFFKKDKVPARVTLHQYGVLISARNEENVIHHLIDSIKNQTYPGELVTVFVVADNCTDKTAQIAKNAGAIVYERFNKEQVGKGYALHFLLNRIGEEYPEDAFDGFFVFDADNLLDENYITEMNKTFSDGHRVITSYRNSKNYGDNWISAGYSLWFLREARFLNHSRMLLNTSCAVSGTGFLFHREIMKKSGGWNFFLLTEDIEFTIYNVINGEKIAYCNNAMLYDEQPTLFRQSWRQRMRWAKGYLQVFRKYGWSLLLSVFKQGCFSCFDMTMSILPAIILTVFSATVNVAAVVFGLIAKDNVLIVAESLWETIRNLYLTLYALGLITTVTEWKKIHCKGIKKVLYTFTFPIFMLTYIPISVTALFRKVEWKPIHHKEAVTLSDIRGIK